MPWIFIWPSPRLGRWSRHGYNPAPLAEQKLIAIDDAKHVAKLARLALDDAHIQRLAGQLASILEYVNQIGRVDTRGVEPMAHALPLHNVLREDRIEPSLALEKVLLNAPDTDGPFFKVPKILGAEEDSAG